MKDAAQHTLIRNDRGGYTVPTARLYPFQWNWDSAFVAMGFATFDPARGFTEIDMLLRGQWDDGLVPQIVFHAPSDDYFPGPEVWGTHHSPPTSGIPQPPVLATATRRLFDTVADRALAEARTAAIYPGLLAWHRWWRAARDPHGTGLVATLHPWETGCDNSPAWDGPMARVPTDTVTTIKRRDTSHIAADMRPRTEDYQRFIHLVDLYRSLDWDKARMFGATPLKFADIGTNAILLRAERDLLHLAGRFGSVADHAEISQRIDGLHAAIGRQFSGDKGVFLSRDLISEAPITVATSAGFLPIYAGAATQAQTKTLASTLRSWARQVKFLVPSTDPSDPAFEAKRYWRGPVWSVVNWMIAEGFAPSDPDLTLRIRADTRALVAQSGLAEYFDPRDGAGLGGKDFSWTAAIDLMLASDDG